MSKAFILLLLLLAVTGGDVSAQTEKRRNFDSGRVGDFSVEMGQKFMEYVQRATEAPRMDFRGMKQIFMTLARIQVSTTRTSRLLSLVPDEYFIDLYGLCHGGPYGEVHFSFDRIDRKTMRMLQKGDSVYVTLEIVQWFSGYGRDPSKNYGDKTIKAIEICCYYDGDFLTGKIANIFVNSTESISL